MYIYKVRAPERGIFSYSQVNALNKPRQRITLAQKTSNTVNMKLSFLIGLCSLAISMATPTPSEPRDLVSRPIPIPITGAACFPRQRVDANRICAGEQRRPGRPLAARLGTPQPVKRHTGKNDHGTRPEVFDLATGPVTNSQYLSFKYYIILLIRISTILFDIDEVVSY